MKKGIIFDMDGVLINSMYDHADAWIYAFKKSNIDILHEDIYEIEGANYKGIVDIIYAKKNLIPTNDDYLTHLNNKRDRFLQYNNSKPFDGMQHVLNILKSKYKLAVASGSDKKIVSDLMDRFYSNVFVIQISGEDVIKGKPDPEPYLKAAEKMDLKPDECIVIENAPLGVQAAKNAGMYCIAVPTYVTKEKLMMADMIIENHSALSSYLLKLAQ